MKTVSIFCICSTAILSIWMLAGCGGDATNQADRPLVATTGMVRDAVQQIIGTNDTVVGMIPSGVDPHLFQTNAEHVRLLRRADGVFYNGLHLEGKMDGVLATLREQGKQVVAVAEALPEAQRIREGEGDESFDPHVWMSVSVWRTVFTNLQAALPDADPAPGLAYLAELDALDRYVRDCVAKIPEERRLLVTAHDAFAYFGRDYGLEVMGIQGISTDDEAGIQRIEELVDLLVDRNVPTIFAESTIPTKNIQSLQEGAASRGHTVAICPVPLYADAMGAEGTYEGTYLGMMDHNATAIARALGGPDAAPAAGRLGKLAADGGNSEPTP